MYFARTIVRSTLMRASACVLFVFLSVVACISASSAQAPAPGASESKQQSPSPWMPFEMARKYATGNGIIKDVQKARTYYEESLKSSDPNVAKASAFALGQLAEQDLKDPTLAAGYYQKGVELGDDWS